MLEKNGKSAILRSPYGTSPAAITVKYSMKAAVKIIRRNTWFPFSLCLLISPSVAMSASWGSCEVSSKLPFYFKPQESLHAEAAHIEYDNVVFSGNRLSMFDDGVIAKNDKYVLSNSMAYVRSIDYFKAPENLQTNSIYIEADDAIFRDEGTSTLKGDVAVAKNGKYFLSDSATFDRATEVLVAKGNVKAKTGSMNVKSDALTVNLKDDTSVITNASYQILQGDGSFDSQGKSKKVEDKGNGISYLSKATYSTCPAEAPSWHITSSKIKLDNNKEVGVARNVTLKVSKKNIPVFYFPYLSFPLTDKRKSGFLVPSYGNSSKSGTSISLPYYFNLAPNYDYTLNPVYLTERGIKLDNEFRYLGTNYSGVLNYNFLAGDELRNGLNRYRAQVNHVAYWGDDTELRVTGQAVSDDNYFDDFSGNLRTSSINKLKRKVSLVTRGDNWKLSGEVENYQVLDGGSNPYTTIPEVNFNYKPDRKISGANITFNSQLVNFGKQEDTSDPTGIRFDTNTKLEKEFSSLAYFLEPSLTLRHTQYELDLNGTTGNSNPSRTLPTFTVDSGLFFERRFSNGEKMQTLEPRFYYTYTPFVDQSDIPLFDTSANSFRYNQLFNENRFSGRDRVEDANRVSLALTSRILEEESGKELFEVSAGQIFHLDDREVALSGNSVDTDSQSELALEISGRITDKVKYSSTALWDAETRDFLNSSVRANYNHNDKFSLNMKYRFRNDSSEQAELQLVLPVKNNWSFSGSMEHDLRNERVLEYVTGLEYKNCCIKTRLKARKFLTSDNKTYDNAIFVEFTFKGLGEFAFSPSDLSSGK